VQSATIICVPDGLNGDVREAWTESCLAGLGEDVAGRLLRDAHPLALIAGEPLHRSGGDPGTCSLALGVRGLLRIYCRAADGREVTVRYVAPGGLIGLPTVLGHPSTPALDCAALRASTLLVLQPDGFRETIATDPSAASALCRYLSDELVEAQQTLAGDVLLPVRSRVACHLLSLAERHERELVVRATPQHLAAAVGSVREVVARVLRCMEQAGLVQRRAGQFVLVDTAALHRVWAGESGL
jgi:CRP-like cAMP-binding protein